VRAVQNKSKTHELADRRFKGLCDFRKLALWERKEQGVRVTVSARRW
jgi:hypothetical protein